MARRQVSRWSHEGLERRGYRKCPYCWRHLVKIDDHIAAHNSGRIGPDGKRRDRTPAEERRWAQRFNGSPGTLRFRADARRMFVPASEVNRLLASLPADPTLLKEADEAVEET